MVSERIAQSLNLQPQSRVLEVGPGMGALTKFLLSAQLKVVEIDKESVLYLQLHYPQLAAHIIQSDFLKLRLSEVFEEETFSLCGNFPYNISSQIVFHALEYRQNIPQMAGMFQKEVAERLAASPGSKVYGILSVLLQAYYDVEYLFTVEAYDFQPPPKVQSGVILARKHQRFPFAETAYPELKALVKQAFNQRRKTLRNALKGYVEQQLLEELQFAGLRAEQLSVQDFVKLAEAVSHSKTV